MVVSRIPANGLGSMAWAPLPGSMMTPGFDSAAALKALAGRIGSLDEPVEIERALDEVTFLCDTLDPELQLLADGLVDTLRRRLAGFPGHA